ncbi:hypothetical protein LCGC14_1757380 [marine sediment metagenome]|uniref:Uncharacterized protein n=1 Tax=marine sediment metagenome TaxID=412755 RepID=A0A0F9JH66_9ZZZZ
MSEPKFKKSFAVYRARKSNDGVAAQFDFNPQSKLLFLEMAAQTNKQDTKGNALFDWKSKIAFKLGTVDIGEILCVLIGKQAGVGRFDDGRHKGLYHENEKGNAVLYFEKGKHGGYYIKLSIRRGEDKIQLSQTLTNGEGIILPTLLRCVVEAKYDW